MTCGEGRPLTPSGDTFLALGVCATSGGFASLLADGAWLLPPAGCAGMSLPGGFQSTILPVEALPREMPLYMDLPLSLARPGERKPLLPLGLKSLCETSTGVLQSFGGKRCRSSCAAAVNAGVDLSVFCLAALRLSARSYSVSAKVPCALRVWCRSSAVNGRALTTSSIFRMTTSNEMM